MVRTVLVTYLLTHEMLQIPDAGRFDLVLLQENIGFPDCSKHYCEAEALRRLLKSLWSFCDTAPLVML